jgi:hypothetical protein
MVIQKDFSKYPRVAAWLSDMRALPEYDAAHAILQVKAVPFADASIHFALSNHLLLCMLPMCLFISILVVYLLFHFYSGCIHEIFAARGAKKCRANGCNQLKTITSIYTRTVETYFRNKLSCSFLHNHQKRSVPLGAAHRVFH